VSLDRTEIDEVDWGQIEQLLEAADREMADRKVQVQPWQTLLLQGLLRQAAKSHTWDATGRRQSPGQAQRLPRGRVERTEGQQVQRVQGQPELARWWAERAEEEIRRTVPKAIEYGSTDLVQIGRTLADTLGRQVSDEEAAELGIYFYCVGKLARWSDAVRRGERPSDDTLFDLGVYVRMAQRVRDAGGWPGHPSEEVNQ